MLFEPDLFSQSLPGWSNAGNAAVAEIEKTLLFFPESLQQLIKSPEQSGAFNLNSSNYRLHTDSGLFFLKRWSPKTPLDELQASLEIMVWLAKQDLPVHPPLLLESDSFILNHETGAWSVFPYDDGGYFSGKDDELDNFAEVAGKLFKSLSVLPEHIRPSIGPVVMEETEHEMFMKIDGLKADWPSIFGPSEAVLLEKWWPKILEEWEAVTKVEAGFGPFQAVHFDLHPHNLLTNDGRITAILDFESCKQMAAGPALGFAALKQCRQAVSLSRDIDIAAKTGSRFIKILSEYYPASKALVGRLGDMAVSEVLRRIGLLLKINMENQNRTWNRVLPIQLNHLGEARALFG